MRIDAHQHFWDPPRVHYPWMEGDAFASIRKPMGPADLEPELRAAGVDATILVQTRASLDETLELLETAAQTDFVAGVVGWADLADPAVEASLDKLLAGPNGRYLVGIRHLVHDEFDPAWIARPDVIAGISAVGRAGLCYDLLTRERELPSCIACVDANPEVRFVVDHMAKPRIGEAAIDPWSGYIGEIARRPNVFCKLSGMVTEANWSSWDPRDFTFYIERVVEVFGEDRIMFGSDWPVCLLASPYAGVVELAETAVSALGAAVREKIFAANAAAFYRLKIRAAVNR